MKIKDAEKKLCPMAIGNRDRIYCHTTQCMVWAPERVKEVKHLTAVDDCFFIPEGWIGPDNIRTHSRPKLVEVYRWVDSFDKGGCGMASLNPLDK